MESGRPTYRVLSPPELAARSEVEHWLAPHLAAGRTTVLYGYGPEACTVALQALRSLAKTMPLQVHDPDGTTAQWERLSKAGTPRTATRKDATRQRWGLVITSGPTTIRLAGPLRVEGIEPDAMISVTADSETIVDEPPGRRYLLGPGHLRLGRSDHRRGA